MALGSVLCIGKICASAAAVIGAASADAPLEHLKEIFEALGSGGEAAAKLRGPDIPTLRSALRSSQKVLEKAYADSLKNSHSAGFVETVDLAFANLAEVFDACMPHGQQLAKLKHDPDAIGAFVADAAVGRQIDAFRDGEGRKILIALVALAYTSLDRKPEFMAGLQRVNWKETFEQLAAVKQDTAIIRSDTAAIRAAVDRLTRDLDLTESARWQLEADLASVRTEYGGTIALVAGFLQTIVGRNIPPEQFALTLMELAANWRAAGRQIDALSMSRNLSPALLGLRDRLAKAYRNEEIETVEVLLSEVAAAEESALDRLVSYQAEVSEEIELRRKGLAATKTAQANLAVATLRYGDAARLLVEGLAIEITDQKNLFDAIRAKQDEFYVEGRDKGSNAALEVSISIAELSVANSENADQQRAAFNDLAVSLQTLGERESGTARLEQAVAAYRAALEENTRERVPLEWAMTQNNLGNALRTLGQRESGTARLEQAVAAYRAALEERTRERVPLGWATTQNNLGNALQTLGQRESGTARLEQAVAAYRAALEENTRERVPLSWATMQNNLGNALQRLGERESGTARLEEAVAAYRAALEERTRERVPLGWATTQNNLGNALQRLGERESGTARLEEAVAAYRAALEERTRERVPLSWAMTQNNLGNALSTLGERESGTARLEQAVAAYRAALEERTRERVPLDWAMTQNNLGNALSTLGQRESGTARLEEAVAAYRAALEELTQEQAPWYWEQTTANLHGAQRLLAEREGKA